MWQDFNTNILKLEILQNGSVELDRHWKKSNVCDYFTRLYFVYDGSGKLTDECGTVNMEKGNVYIIPSGCHFSYSCEYLKKIYFHVIVPSPDNYDMLGDIGRIYSLPADKSTLEALSESYHHKSCGSFLKIMSILCDSIYNLADKCSCLRTEPAKYSTLVEKAIDYIVSTPRIDLSVKDIAAALYVSESKLRNKFLTEVGTTIGKYMDDMIFINAKKMIASDIPLDTIAQNLGFCDRFYLSRRFKERFGKTISAYRSEISPDAIKS